MTSMTVTTFRGSKSQTLAGGNFGAAQLVCFTRTLMSNERLVYYDLQA